MAGVDPGVTDLVTAVTMAPSFPNGRGRPPPLPASAPEPEAITAAWLKQRRFTWSGRGLGMHAAPTAAATWRARFLRRAAPADRARALHPPGTAKTADLDQLRAGIAHAAHPDTLASGRRLYGSEVHCRHRPRANRAREREFHRLAQTLAWGFTTVPVKHGCALTATEPGRSPRTQLH
jgi:hypothetical protein